MKFPSLRDLKLRTRGVVINTLQNESYVLWFYLSKPFYPSSSHLLSMKTSSTQLKSSSYYQSVKTSLLQYEVSEHLYGKSTVIDVISEIVCGNG